MKKAKKVGVFKLGPENVELWVDPAISGGTFNLCPRSGGMAEIRIGVNEQIEVLIHELFEFCAARLQLRFIAAPSFTRSHADYLFVMTHEQFTEVAARVGCFMSDAIPKLKLKLK
jgi:hypothetical protein